MDYSKIKVIYFDSTEITLDNIVWGLLQLDFDVEKSHIKVNLTKIVPEEIDEIKSVLGKYQFAFTQDFSVNVAIACHDMQIPYISWIYDSPQVSLYTDCALYDTNYVFAFDKAQVKRLKKYGIEHIYHLPLAANIAYSSGIIVSDDDIRKYRSDISFIGQLYRRDYMDVFLNSLPENARNELLLRAEEKALKWGPDISIFNSISDESAETIASHMIQEDFSKFHVDKKFSEEVLFLAPLIAEIERKQILRLAGEKFRTTLYTREKDIEYAKDNIPGVKVNGPVYEELPYKVYYATKLNLNLTLRCIETAVPQRIFDIMSVGGAVISNYQEEIAELFEPDEEVILFNSPEEFVDKTQFYLDHSKHREKIGIAGYMKVKDKYNYITALKSIFEIVLSNT